MVDWLGSTENTIKGCLAAVGILCGVGIVAYLILWKAESYSSLKLCILAFLVAAVAPVIALLITHRLFFGDWWPFWGPITTHLTMFTRGFGPCV